MELFALLLSLVLGVLQAGLSAFPPPFLSSHLHSELLFLLLSGAQGLAGLDAELASTLTLYRASFTHSSAINTF
nr:hypothetical protein CFP56_26187 [Quercus suber]